MVKHADIIALLEDAENRTIAISKQRTLMSELQVLPILCLPNGPVNAAMTTA